ncbi:universal stress protein [Hydrocoleum sp. CS-953]|uniref:universal stress protein n=1 Tax=Hydrocoleum sp. CS-953 TaxID=1671698 RepID=UPI000B9B438F|nr:universal stress protein [Hydrocoleum sp. CS-953]OZH53304.1 universal stress protein [Hydrocoleum sp. CS-953]
MKNIVVAIDFSQITPTIISQAETLAQAFKSKLWLIHITEPEPDFVGFKTGPQPKRDHWAEQFRKEHKQIQDLAEELRQKGLDTVALLTQGSTVETILAEAKKLTADLIIVGSHGRSGIDKLFMGSVSEGILKYSPYPVLVIPAVAEVRS